MTTKIHHVGLAVNNIEETASFFAEVFGAELTAYRMETPEFISRMLTIGESMFELLEPRGRGGLIERFLKKTGEGLHHVSVQVEDLGKVLAACEKKGYALVGNRFIHPKSAHGVLIELIEKKKG